MSDRKLTFGQRVFVWWWERITTLMVGSSNPLTEELVLTFGVREYVSRAGMMYEVLKLLEKRWGTVEAQLVIGFAGLLSGCRWCGVGHLYAANLELFKREGELLPLDEREIPALQEKTDDEVLALVEERFSDPRWAEMKRVLHQQYLLRSGQAEEETRDDQLLQMANHMWEWFNECSIVVMDIDPGTIPPQSFVGKDRKLVERYRQARARKQLETQR